MRRAVVGFLTAVALGGCTDSQKPTNPNPISRSGVVMPVALTPPTATVPARDMQALVKELAPTGPQLAALNQAELALKHLARVDLTNEINLELAVADVLASRACLKAHFSGWALELVTDELPRLALDTYELTQQAERAYAAFQRNPDRGPLQMLEPLDNGCLATEESMPTVVDDLVESPPPVAEPALVENETFIDKAGNPTPAPAIIESTVEAVALEPSNNHTQDEPTSSEQPLAVIIEPY